MQNGSLPTRRGFFYATAIGATPIGAALSIPAVAHPQCTGSKVLDVTSSQFGACGDGKCDDTAAVQAALDVASQTGFPVLFPRGTYRIARTLIFDHSHFVREAGLLGVDIHGHGSGCTELLWTGGSAEPCLVVRGGLAGSAMALNSKICGLRFSALGPRRGVGLKVEIGAYILFEDIFFFNLYKGVELEDVASVTWLKCVWRFNKCALEALPKKRFTSPNSLDFYGCVLANNDDCGIQLNGCASVNLFGGSIESNGVTGADDERFGVKVVNAGHSGGIGLSAVGVYFENNRGIADVWIVQGPNPAIYNFTNCVFNRVGSLNSPKHNVLASQGSQAGELLISFRGCAFRGLAGYGPNEKNAYIHMDCLGAHRLSHFDCLFDSPLESPDEHSLQATGICAFDGTTEPVSILIQNNIAQVSRNGVGDYTVVLRRPSGGTKMASITLNENGKVWVSDEPDFSSIRIRTADGAGAPQDFSKIMVVIY